MDKDEKIATLRFFMRSGAWLIVYYLSRHLIRRSLSRFCVKFDWRKLSSFGNSSAAKISVLAPFVGFAVFYNERLKAYLGVTLSDSQCFHQTIISLLAVRLDVFYLGLVFLGAGSFVYSMFSPNVVKQYPSAFSFGHSMVSIPLAFEQVNFLLSVRQALDLDFKFLRRAWDKSELVAGLDFRRDLMRYIDSISQGHFFSSFIRLNALITAILQRIELDTEIPERKRKFMSSRLKDLTTIDPKKVEPEWTVTYSAISNLNYVGYEVYWGRHAKDSIFDLSIVYYGVVARTRPLARTVVAVFWVIGLVLILAPTCLTALYVAARVGLALGITCGEPFQL